MGFAAGFGEAFSRSFEQQRQRSHERETDEFRYRMETLVKDKDKYDAHKKEDSQYAGLAKDIVQNTGAPPEAVGKAYGMLKNGASYDDVMKVFQGGKFKVTKAAEEQTEAAMGTPTEDTTQPAAPAPGLDGGGLLSQVFPGMKKFGGSREERVNQRVQTTTGMTPEEIAQIDAGYTPPDMNTGEVEYTPQGPAGDNITDAKIVMDEANFALKANPSDPGLQQAADAARRRYETVVQAKTVEGKVSDVGQANGTLGTTEVVATGPDGQKRVLLANQTVDGFVDPATGQPLPDARSRTVDEVKMEADIQEKLGEPALKHQEAAANLAQAYTAYGIADKIIQENPNVLQERTAGLTQYFVDLGKDIVAGMEVVNEALASPETADPNELMAIEKKLEEKMADPSLGEAQKLAAAKGLLDVQYALGAYHVASAMGQDGRALQENERKMFTDLPNNATSYEQWKQLIGSILVPQKQALDKKAEMLPQSSPWYDDFIRRYQYSPVGPLDKIEKYLEGTEGADLDRTLPQSGYQAVTTPEESRTEVPDPAKAAPADYPGYTYVGKTPDGKPLYKDENGVVGTME